MFVSPVLKIKSVATQLGKHSPLSYTSRSCLIWILCPFCTIIVHFSFWLNWYWTLYGFWWIGNDICISVIFNLSSTTFIVLKIFCGLSFHSLPPSHSLSTIFLLLPQISLFQNVSSWKHAIYRIFQIVFFHYIWVSFMSLNGLIGHFFESWIMLQYLDISVN